MKFPFFAITAFILGSVSAYAGNDPIFRNMSQTQELDSLLDELNSLSHAPQPVHAPAPVSHAPAHVHPVSHSPAAVGQQHARMEQIDPPMGGRGNDDLDFNLPPEQDNGPAARHHGPHHGHHQCFTAGTAVFTPDHTTPFKAIELLVQGDKVWSCNTDESQCVEREVVNVSVTKSSELVLVHTQQANGTEEVIKTTPDHPFYKEGEKTPTFARDLEKGNSLWAYQDAVTVTQVESKEVHPSVLVYNIQVEAPEGGNNYFVGEHLILVHNCNMADAAAAAVATGACVVEGARCVIGAATVVGEIAAAPETGGGSLAGIPASAGQTTDACARATVTCGAAGATIVNVFSSGGDSAASGGTESTKGSIEKVSDRQLDKLGIDAHELKKDFLGKKAKISEYDIYKNKDTGELELYKKGGKGEGIRTGEYFK